MNDERKLNDWIDLYFDQQLDPADRVEFEDRLRRDAGARQRFWERADMDGLLQEWGRMQSGVEEITRHVPTRSPRWSIWTILPYPSVAIAAALAIATLIGLRLVTREKRDTTAPLQRIVSGRDAVAVFTQTAEACWEKSSIVPGDFVAIGDLNLLSGAAGFEFAGGDVVTIGAPARIRINSANEIDCKEGHVTVHRPADAEPFTVITPAGVVAEIQNQVTMLVGSGGTDMLAYNGTALVKMKSGGTHRVTEGEGIRSTSSGLELASATAKAALAVQAHLAGQMFAQRTGPSGRWRILSQRQNEDPHLLVRYTFDPSGPDLTSLPNRAAASDGLPEGRVTGGFFGEGSRPGKSALHLDSPRDGVQFSLPGSYPSVTLAMRIFINKLDNEYNSLCMSAGIDPGGLHWQIHRSGTLELGVFGNPALPPYRVFPSPAAWMSRSLGSWHHLAAVYDSHEGSISHYVDGKLASISPMGKSPEVEIGDAMIGNWDPFRADDPNSIRFLHGRIDDFSIYCRALTANEISVLHDLGRR